MNREGWLYVCLIFCALALFTLDAIGFLEADPSAFEVTK